MDKLLLFINTAMLAMFVENAIFSRALGTSVAFYASRKKESIIGLGLGITYVTVLSSFITFWFDAWLYNWEYYYVVMPLIYTFIVSFVYTTSLLLIWRFLPKLFRSIKKYVHLSVFNAAVLGALFLNTVYRTDLLQYMAFGLGISAGFFIAVFFLHIANERLNSPLIPEAFRGMPIMMVFVGIMSLAFYALTGYNTGAIA
jgi:electron transport complex protein RnfA